MKKQMLYIMLCILMPYWAVSQCVYMAERIGYSQGLPSDNVNGVVSKNGKLFVATKRGLCQYDGYQFIKDSTIVGAINCLFSKKNKLYFYAASLGLCSKKTIFDQAKVLSKTNFSDSISNNDHYENIFVDSRNFIWCTDYNSIKYFNGKRFFYFTFQNKKLSLDQNFNFLEINKGQILITSSAGIYVWDSRTNQIAKHQNQFLKTACVVSAVLKNKMVFLTTNQGFLYTYKPTENQLYKQKIPIDDNFYLHLVNHTEIFKNKVVLYNKHTLYTYDFKKKNVVALYFSENEINHVYFDSQLQLFWLSTNRGLIKLTPCTKNIVPLAGTLAQKAVSFAQDSQLTIWSVYNNNQLQCTPTNAQTTTRQAPTGLRFCAVFCQNIKVFLASNKGLYQFFQGKFKLIIPTQVGLKKVIVDAQNHFWLLPEKGPIRLFDANSFKEIPNFCNNKKTYWEENLFNDLAMAPNGRIWLASWMPKEFGISYFDTQQKQFVQICNLQQYNNRPLFVTDYFNRIGFTKKGTILFSGYGGWNIVSPRGKIIFSFFTDKYKVANDHIEGISEDNKGTIWFACAEGLNQYSFKTDKVVRVASLDGLASDDLTYGYFKLKNDQLLLGTYFGSQQVDLNKVTQSQLINKLELTAIIKDGIYQNPSANELIVNHDFTQIDLLFSALTFAEKAKIIYRYQFEGEKKWHNLGANPKLSFIKLSPGSYTLKIEAGDNLGHWQAQSIRFFIKVKPPFYYRYWFIGLILLVLVAVGFVISRYFVGQEKIKGILKRQIKEMEMQTLRSQMNPHFVFNTLNSINSYIIQNQKEIASDYLTRFSKLMRNILDLSKHEAISLFKEIQTLQLYLELEALRLENKFDYSIIIDHTIEQDLVQIPPLIIQPFVENAIWHGIINKKMQGTIYIKIKKTGENQIEICVEDDGIGRRAASKLKIQQVHHKSYGIDITINRLQLLDAQNSVAIIDLYDAQQNALGTKVLIKILTDS